MANKIPVKPRRSFSLLHREEGQAAFEFVLVLPVFIVLLLLMVDLGIMTYHYVSVSNAVREGARYGAVNCGSDGSCTQDDIVTRTIDRSGGILSKPDDVGDVTVGWVDNPPTDTKLNGKGDSVVVKVNHEYKFMFFLGVSIPITSCADMRLEQTDGTVDPPEGSEC